MAFGLTLRVLRANRDSATRWELDFDPGASLILTLTLTLRRPRCALWAMPSHRGCNFERVPALGHARITQRELEPDFDPAEPEGSSTSGWLVMATTRSIVHNANPGIASPPCAWSIETGQCSAARTPPWAVRPSRWPDQEAARLNRSASLLSVPVTSQGCAQEAADQAARTRWPPGRQHGRGLVEGHHEGVLYAACGR